MSPIPETVRGFLDEQAADELAELVAAGKLVPAGVRMHNTPECEANWGWGDRFEHEPGCWSEPVYRWAGEGADRG